MLELASGTLIVGLGGVGRLDDEKEAPGVDPDPDWDSQARPEPPDLSMSTSSTKSAHVNPHNRMS